MSYEKTTRVRLSYDPLKWDFIAFKINIMLARKRIVDTDVVNGVTSTRQSVITRVVIRFFTTRRHPLQTATKSISSLQEKYIKMLVEGLSYGVTVRLISSLTSFLYNAVLVFLR